MGCATHWLSDYVAGGVKEQAIQEHLDQGHTSPLDPHLSDKKCEACAKAFAQDKPAYQVSKTAKEDKLETLNGDLLDMGNIDCAGNRYNFNAVMLRTGYGVSDGMGKTTSSNTMKLFKKFKL